MELLLDGANLDDFLLCPKQISSMSLCTWCFFYLFILNHLVKLLTALIHEVNYGWILKKSPDGDSLDPP
ncbi:hypothetical protein L1887_05230 [Cichorium endivia]|nr:hypothetical protein L1887_05230 [Cichorium endivia]